MKPTKPRMPWFGFKALCIWPALISFSVVGVISACRISTFSPAALTAATAPSAEPASGLHCAVRSGLACNMAETAEKATFGSCFVT